MHDGSRFSVSPPTFGKKNLDNNLKLNVECPPKILLVRISSVISRITAQGFRICSHRFRLTRPILSGS